MMNRTSLCVALIRVAFITAIAIVCAPVAVRQDFYWRDYSHGEVPVDALEGGVGKYIGQVYHTSNGLLPATIYPHRNEAVAISVGRLYFSEHIKILCTAQPQKFYWSRVSFNDSVDGVMKDVVKGGFQDDHNLFIGSVNHEGENKIGKVVGVDNFKTKGLYVWNKDGEKVKVLDFYLLKYNSSTDFSDDYVICRS